DHRLGFGRGVVAAHQAGPRPSFARRSQPKPWATRIGPHDVGQVQDPLPGTEVLLKADDAGAGNVVGELDQMAAVSAPEAVHGLRVVADHGEADAVGTQQPHDVDLDLVDVLVLVDEHV